MKFIDKLTANTKNGSMDYLWKYMGSSEIGRYSIQKPKYVLSGLSLGSNPKEGEIIFPNGVAMQYEEGEMSKLIDAIIESLDRTVNDIIVNYDIVSEIEDESNEETEEDKNADEDKEKEDNEN